MAGTLSLVLLTLSLTLLAEASGSGHHEGEAVSEAGSDGHRLGSYHHHKDPHHTKPHYAYKYGVHDKHTGDVKDAWEHRDGDVTKGGYSVLEPDGHTRVVEYTVTKKGGFQATVKRLPPHH